MTKNTAIKLKVGDKVKCNTMLSTFYGVVKKLKLKNKLAEVKYYKKVTRLSKVESSTELSEWEDIDGLELITPLEELL